MAAARTAAALQQYEDKDNGGFGGAPKFPQPSWLELMYGLSGDVGGARETLPQFVAAAAAFAAANGGAAPDWAAIKARNHALKQREAQVAAQQQAQQAQQQTQQTHQPAPQSQQLGALGPRAIAGGRAGDRGAPDGGKDDEVGFLG